MVGYEMLLIRSATSRRDGGGGAAELPEAHFGSAEPAQAPPLHATVSAG